MKLSLLVLTTGKQEGKKLEIKVSPFLIGRDAECHLRPASPMISKKHCAFVVKNDQVFLQDFGSTNGSIVNGTPIQGETELNHKDHVKIGPLEFEVILDKAAVSEPVAKKPDSVNKKAGATVKKPATVGATTNTAESETVAEKAAKRAESTSGSNDEDEIAAMLMSLGDDDSATSGTATNESIPDGSTMMEIPIPAELAGEGGEGEKSKHEKSKESQQNTSQAARDILSRYMRRPR